MPVLPKLFYDANVTAHTRWHKTIISPASFMNIGAKTLES